MVTKMMLGHTTMGAPDWAKAVTFGAGAGALAAALLDLLGTLGDKRGRTTGSSMMATALKGAFIGGAAGAVSAKVTLGADPSLHPVVTQGLRGWGAGSWGVSTRAPFHSTYLRHMVRSSHQA